MADSIFSKILKREITSQLIYEDDFVFAINDINPIAPIHILIIPKEEIPTVNDIDQENSHLLGKMVLAAQLIADSLDIAEKGYRLIFNCNDDGGQTVYHLHCHFLAGKKLKWNEL